MSTSTRIRLPRRVGRAVALSAAGLALVLVVGILVNSFAASRAEHRLATAIQSAPGITFEPEVMMNGFPFLARAHNGSFPFILISARGTSINGCADRGACTATVDARLTDPVIGNVWNINETSNISYGSIVSETRIDSVNLGRLMGITDLYINTPAPVDKIGGGGPGDGLLERTDGIMLSGTVPLPGSPERDGKYPPSASGYRFPAVKISVTARTFVADGRVHIKATGIYTGPEEHYAADVPEEFYAHVLERFSTTLPPLPMAWGIAPEKALSRGSDLIVLGGGNASTVAIADYLPARSAGH